MKHQYLDSTCFQEPITYDGLLLFLKHEGLFQWDSVYRILSKVLSMDKMTTFKVILAHFFHQGINISLLEVINCSFSLVVSGCASLEDIIP